MRLLDGEAVFRAIEHVIPDSYVVAPASLLARGQGEETVDRQQSGMPMATSAQGASGALSADDAQAFTSEGLPRAVWWDSVEGTLALIDQTRLPGELKIAHCYSVEDVAYAIKDLKVRGAPAIGIAAAYGLVIGLDDPTVPLVGIPLDLPLSSILEDVANYLRRQRPTAVNLGWALDRMLRCSREVPLEGDEEQYRAGLRTRLHAEAHTIAAEDAAACRAMGAFGAELIADGDAVLTHCNAGALATGGMGTALAPIYTAHRAGKRVHVYVDETRPVLQGARLTAWELSHAGVPLTLITDNMAASMLRRANIRAVFVGADRIAANGDVANKIGTYGLAILARHHGVPFYVVAPRSTLDLSLPSGDAIPIEERPSYEVTRVGNVRTAPEGVSVANPAFDVTPAELVTAIITEAGVARSPFGPALVHLSHNPFP